MIEEAMDVTVNEVVQQLAEERSVPIGCGGLDVGLGKRSWTFKKRPHMHWSRSAPTF
jgi:hypothetical protein